LSTADFWAELSPSRWFTGQIYTENRCPQLHLRFIDTQAHPGKMAESTDPEALKKWPI
jgi:hypothetical protein